MAIFPRPAPLVARQLAVRLRPLQAARRLVARQAPGVALLHSAEAVARATTSYLAAFPDAVSADLDPYRVDQAVAVAGTLAAVPRWIGVVPYESRRGLEREDWRPPERRPAPELTKPCWARYPAVVRFQRSQPALVVGVDLAAVERLRQALEGPDEPAGAVRVTVDSAEADALHLARISRARELILAGDLYQVCLARRLEVSLHGRPIDLYAQMAGRACPEYGAYLELGDDIRVLSTSPELLLRAQVDPTRDPPGQLSTLWSEPIKGTRPRGAHAQADAVQRAELRDDPKEQAELAMIVDVVRNDLGSVARAGSVRLAQAPHIATHRTVHHRRALLTATADPAVPRAEVLAALVPSGSVTGAPKIRAMEVIAELESARRGLYTGGIGYVSHAGEVNLAMAIRTLVLNGQQGHYWSGGGIVADSDPEREWQETGWKARQLLSPPA